MAWMTLLEISLLGLIGLAGLMIVGNVVTTLAKMKSSTSLEITKIIAKPLGEITEAFGIQMAVLFAEVGTGSPEIEMFGSSESLTDEQQAALDEVERVFNEDEDGDES
jgi:hypothetical protein